MMNGSSEASWPSRAAGKFTTDKRSDFTTVVKLDLFSVVNCYSLRLGQLGGWASWAVNKVNKHGYRS